MAVPVGLALAAGIPAVAQSAFGIYQALRGRKLAREAVRPEYEIPEEIKQMLSTAQMRALEGLPAEQRRQYVENVQRSALMGARQLTTRRAGLAGLPGLAQAQIEGYRGLLAEDVAARERNIASLQQARGTMAQFREREFELEQMEPYRAQVQAAAAMKAAGLQNIMGGLQQIGGIAGQALYLEQIRSMLGTTPGRQESPAVAEFKPAPGTFGLRGIQQQFGMAAPQPGIFGQAGIQLGMAAPQTIFQQLGGMPAAEGMTPEEERGIITAYRLEDISQVTPGMLEGMLKAFRLEKAKQFKQVEF